MKCLPRSIGLAILAFGALTFGAAADGPGFHALGESTGRGIALGRLKRCLSMLDLSADQKSAIRQILSDAKSTLQADIQVVRSDHEKLETDIKTGADNCVIGQDALARHTDAAKLRGDVQAVRDQIASHLTTEQQSRLKGCFDATGPGRFSRQSD
jgi:Spy/CpxP family protein refolding chaperone